MKNKPQERKAQNWLHNFYKVLYDVYFLEANVGTPHRRRELCTLQTLLIVIVFTSELQSYYVFIQIKYHFTGNQDFQNKLATLYS